jgi:hypothetical protein
MNGRTYPAKFIRGLAYRLATGVELDPNRDYSGGAETARFFQGLGLATSASAAPVAATPPPDSPPPPVPTLVTPTSPRKYEPQKQALFDVLKKRFGTVECEAEFSWLVVPSKDQLKEPLASIFQALQEMRGFSNFAGAGRSLRCDFYISQERLIVEYDERQHFTIQRAKALKLYSSDISLEFDRQEWIKTCNSIKASDPNPPYRDEQRAFYDSLRDILAARNGVRLIRLRYGNFDWTGTGADEQLSKVLASGQALVSQPAAGPTVQAASSPAVDQIRKVALVSHDYNVTDSRGMYDYSEHFARINKLCDEEGCDTILYALYTWDRDSAVPRNHDSIFGGLANVRRVILEVGQPPDSYKHVEVWLRGQQAPMLAHQRFARSLDHDHNKRHFVRDLPTRQMADAALMICGESNIVKLKRASNTFEDPFGFCDYLQRSGTRVVLNPIHDYMTRYEMRAKRCYYSVGGRTVISIWNQGRGKESSLPWTVFHNGVERTNTVRELQHPFPDRGDIRIGIAEVSSLEDHCP